MWRTLRLHRAPECAIDCEQYCSIPGRLDKAIQAKADTMGTISKERWKYGSMEVWKYAWDL